MIAAVLGALLFTIAGSLGALLGLTISDRLERFTDGPPVGQPPIPALVAGCAVLGALVANHAAFPAQVLLLAALATALVAVWVTDARRGIIPDIFTLGPLAIVVLVAVVTHHWGTILSAALPFAPFALAAAISRGRGMGWGDAKLVALGGAVLGAQVAMPAVAGACLAAVIVHHARGERRTAIAFAPYLVTAIGIALPIAMVV